MRTILCCVAIAWLAALSAPASAEPLLPKAGEQLSLQGGGDWPGLTWLYDSPSSTDAAGKVVIHWFCAQRIKTCAADLARLITLRDTGHVYIVAYINGPIADAKKLDPIRESEGVGKGTVAYGPAVTKLVKQLSLTAEPTSIVVDTDGKVKAVSTSGDLNELDSRDSVVSSLIANIKDFTSSKDGPATVKAGEKFNLGFKIQLAPWLTFSNKNSPEVRFTTPKEVKCEKTSQIEGHTLATTATCTGPHGNYEAVLKLRFSYNVPGTTALGTGEDGATWKFEIK